LILTLINALIAHLVVLFAVLIIFAQLAIKVYILTQMESVFLAVQEWIVAL
jgi:hypothetical protein